MLLFVAKTIEIFRPFLGILVFRTVFASVIIPSQSLGSRLEFHFDVSKNDVQFKLTAFNDSFIAEHFIDLVMDVSISYSALIIIISIISIKTIEVILQSSHPKDDLIEYIVSPLH